MKTVSCFCALILLAALFAASAAAATFSLNPGADAFVTTGPTANLVNSNYGGAGALAISAPGSAQGEFQSVLQFSLAGAKSSFDAQFGAGQWTIQSIALQLTATPPNNAIFNADAAGQFNISWMQNDSWTEGSGTPAIPGASGITYSTLNSFLSGADETLGTFSFNGATSGAFTYNLALTPSFSADVLNGNTTSFRMFAADSLISFLSDSRSFTTTSARPVLTITAVPEPSVFGLAALGVCLLCRRSRLGRR